MRVYLAVILLVFATAQAEARRKPVPKQAHLSRELCSFAAGATAPDWPQAKQKMALGDCPPRSTPR